MPKTTGLEKVADRFAYVCGDVGSRNSVKRTVWSLYRILNLYLGGGRDIFSRRIFVCRLERLPILILLSVPVGYLYNSTSMSVTSGEDVYWKRAVRPYL